MPKVISYVLPVITRVCLFCERTYDCVSTRSRYCGNACRVAAWQARTEYLKHYQRKARKAKEASNGD